MGSTAYKIPIGPDVLRQLNSLAHELFADMSTSEIGLESDWDHDGDPILRLTILHNLMAKRVNLSEVRAKDALLRERIWELGESRFLHIRHDYNEAQAVG